MGIYPSKDLNTDLLWFSLVSSSRRLTQGSFAINSASFKLIKLSNEGIFPRGSQTVRSLSEVSGNLLVPSSGKEMSSTGEVKAFLPRKRSTKRGVQVPFGGRFIVRWLWLKKPVPNWNPGKWKHGPKPA